MALTFDPTGKFADSNTPLIISLISSDMFWGDTDGLAGPFGTQVPMDVGPARPQLRWGRGGEPDSIRDKSIFTKEDED